MYVEIMFFALSATFIVTCATILSKLVDKTDIGYRQWIAAFFMLLGWTLFSYNQLDRIPNVYTGTPTLVSDVQVIVVNNESMHLINVNKRFDRNFDKSQEFEIKIYNRKSSLGLKWFTYYTIDIKR